MRSNRVEKIVSVRIVDLQLHHLHVDHPVLLLFGHHADQLVVHVASIRVGTIGIEALIRAAAAAITVQATVSVITVLFFVPLFFIFEIVSVSGGCRMLCKNYEGLIFSSSFPGPRIRNQPK